MHLADSDCTHWQNRIRLKLQPNTNGSLLFLLLFSYGFPCDLKVTGMDARTFYMYIISVLYYTYVVHVRHSRRSDVDMYHTLGIRPMV